MREQLKLLIADDNQAFCQNIADILALQGHLTTVVYDGMQAVEIIEQETFDLTLIDMRMPGLDGVGTLRMIKQVRSDLPVIMITAFALEDAIREALREGAFGILKKPLDFDVLFRTIQAARPDGSLILVVDENRDMCVNVSGALRGRNYRVSMAHDSTEAMEQVKQNNYDFILMDMKLGPLNGLQTYHVIRDIRPDAKVIIVTGYMDEMGEMCQRALEEDACTYMEKPIDMDKLLHTLEHARRYPKPGGRVYRNRYSDRYYS